MSSAKNVTVTPLDEGAAVSVKIQDCWSEGGSVEFVWIPQAGGFVTVEVKDGGKVSPCGSVDLDDLLIAVDALREWKAGQQ